MLSSSQRSPGFVTAFLGGSGWRRGRSAGGGLGRAGGAEKLVGQGVEPERGEVYPGQLGQAVEQRAEGVPVPVPLEVGIVRGDVRGASKSAGQSTRRTWNRAPPCPRNSPSCSTESNWAPGKPSLAV